MVAFNYFFNNNGQIVPQTEDILDQVTAEFQTAFGTDMDTSPFTPQGILIAAETAARTAVINNNCLVANQINPNLAGGINLDAIGSLTALQRTMQTYSQAIIVCNGVSGTVIDTTVTIQDANGNIYQNITPVTLTGSPTN